MNLENAGPKALLFEAKNPVKNLHSNDFVSLSSLISTFGFNLHISPLRFTPLIDKHSNS